MGTDGFGSSIIVALAALLWVAYLVPTWFRRREYISTERNAVRLQQTLRIMAETAELPEPVRVETSTRAVAQQERLLRKELQRQAAITRAQAAASDRAAARASAEAFDRAQAESAQAAAKAAAVKAAAVKAAAVQAAVARSTIAQPRQETPVRVSTSVRQISTPSSSLAAHRIRRTRGFVSLVLLASLVGTGFGVAQLLAASGWALLAGSAFGAVSAIALLGRLATVKRGRIAVAQAPRVRTQLSPAVVQVAAPQVVETAGWTPVPLPKPLYLSRPQVDRAVAASLEAAAELRQAAADAERALREAQAAGEVTPIRRATPEAPAARPSRFAAMGYLDAPATGTPDLDAALARRRASAAS
jgi:hypothetical protein